MVQPRGEPVDEQEALVPADRLPDVVLPAESALLDLDGDGVPDAVFTRGTVGYDLTGDGVADLVEVTDEIASEIDVDGVPAHVELTHTVEADVDHDGTLDVVNTVSVDPDPGAAPGPSRRRRPGLLGRARRARLRGRGRGRQQRQGFGAVRVSPQALLAALEEVSASSSPEGDVRVSIDRDVVGLAVHATHAGWWAATAVGARLRRGSPTAVTVERASLREALRLAATSHGRGTPVIVQSGAGVWVGDHEVAAALEADRQVSPPPDFESWEPGERDVVVPTIEGVNGETTFPFRGGTITTTNSFLRALRVWAIARVSVFEAAGLVFLLGRSGEDGRPHRIIAMGEARIAYTDANPETDHAVA